MTLYDCTTKKEYKPTIKKYYQLLAQFMVDITGTDCDTILEIGCGSGNLTEELHSLVCPSVYIGVDLYSGVYAKSLTNIKKEKVFTVIGDITYLGVSTESI